MSLSQLAKEVDRFDCHGDDTNDADATPMTMMIITLIMRSKMMKEMIMAMMVIKHRTRQTEYKKRKHG